jgi:tetratricopeptide (TPR) repeat protein
MKPTVPPLLFLAFFAAAAPAFAGSSPSAARVEELVRAGDDDAAIALGEELVRAEPGDALLWRALGEAYGEKARAASVLTRLRYAKKCRAAFERSVELAPDDIDSRTALFTYDMEAPAIAGGSAARAREEAEAIAKLNPGRGHCALGALLHHEKDYGGAETEYRRALELEPENAEARAGLAALLLEQSRFDESRRYWSGLVDDPELGAMAHYQLGRISLASGTRFDEGAEHFRLYLASPPPPGAPSWADADWQLALVYEKLGRKEEAIVALRDALKKDPEHGPAKKDLKRLGG